MPCPEPGHAPAPWQGSTRRAGLRTRSGSRQQKLRRFVLHRDGNRCHVCGKVKPDEELVNDHVIPIAEGGADDVTNMAPCCISPCHTEKTAEEARRGRTRTQA